MILPAALLGLLATSTSSEACRLAPPSPVPAQEKSQAEPQPAPQPVPPQEEPKEIPKKDPQPPRDACPACGLG